MTSYSVPERQKSPSLLYPTPVTSTSIPLTNRTFTVISFLVIVPVLSDAITVVEPSVSTDGRRLTMAFFCTII